MTDSPIDQAAEPTVNFLALKLVDDMIELRGLVHVIDAVSETSGQAQEEAMPWLAEKLRDLVEELYEQAQALHTALRDEAVETEAETAPEDDADA